MQAVSHTLNSTLALEGWWHALCWCLSLFPCTACSQTACLLRPASAMVPVSETHTQHCTGATWPSSASHFLSTDLLPALYRKREREEEPLPPSRGAKQPRINVMGQVEGQHLLAACGGHAGTLLRAAGNLMCAYPQVLHHALCLPLLLELTSSSCLHATCLPSAAAPSCSDCSAVLYC